MSEKAFETRIPFEHRVENTPDITETAVAAVPTPAESTREAVPMVKSVAPNTPTRTMMFIVTSEKS